MDATTLAAAASSATQPSGAVPPAGKQPAAPGPTPRNAAESTPPLTPPANGAIHVALNENGQRVELRITQQSGDIHVAVRTPDSKLATAMREDLPALSSNLEQRGFHAEMWRPAAASALNEVKPAEPSAGNAMSDSSSPSRERRQQQHEQERDTKYASPRKNDRKEFSWLLASIR